MSENKGNVPKIRFPGFTDAWEQRKLGAVGIIRTGRSKFISNIEKTKETPYAVLGSTSVISYAREYDYSGDFILTARVGANAGDLYQYSGNVKISDNTVFLQGKSLNFLFYLLTKLNLKNLSFGTGQPLIKASELSNLDLLFPRNIEEQTQIGSFFMDFDNLITLHQRKLNNVQKLKTGLLKKMFPKDGEYFPEIRFPEFTDAWEQRKLGELAKFSKGNGYTKNDLTESGSPIVLYGRLYTKYETVINDVDTFVKIKDKSVVSEGNEVVVPASGETAEDISRASVIGKSGFILGGDLNIIKTNQEINPIFLALTISNGTQQKEISKCAQGKSVVHLHNSDLKQVNLLYPELEEQQRIGKLFLDFDQLISLHQRKLEHLQEQKKSLLQQMFV